MAEPGKQTAIRFTAEDMALIEALQRKLGVNLSGLVRMAIRRLAEQEKIKPKKGAPR